MRILPSLREMGGGVRERKREGARENERERARERKIKREKLGAWRVLAAPLHHCVSLSWNAQEEERGALRRIAACLVQRAGLRAPKRRRRRVVATAFKLFQHADQMAIPGRPRRPAASDPGRPAPPHGPRHREPPGGQPCRSAAAPQSQLRSHRRGDWPAGRGPSIAPPRPAWDDYNVRSLTGRAGFERNILQPK